MSRVLRDVTGRDILLRKYSDDEPRDDQGKWTSGGDSGGSGSSTSGSSGGSSSSPQVGDTFTASHMLYGNVTGTVTAVHQNGSIIGTVNHSDLMGDKAVPHVAFNASEISGNAASAPVISSSAGPQVATALSTESYDPIARVTGWYQGRAPGSSGPKPWWQS